MMAQFLFINGNINQVINTINVGRNPQYLSVNPNTEHGLCK